jgi:hypothetical protein
MIVANLVQHTIGKEENEVTIYDDRARTARARAQVEDRPRHRRARASSSPKARRVAKQSLP